MSHPAISIEDLSKAYRIGLEEQRHDTLVGSMIAAARYPLKNFHRLRRLNTFRHCDESEDIFWALRDVSFDVAEGEVVGIIGRNGAGKSTLLKVLSRITEPTSGRAVIRGRVSSLLEVGTGFHQELTGRENVYMNGTILGMTKREIDRKFDQIVDFSGVEKFLDTPIKHYSSGMKVRLAFSVAAHLEPEILIIDEVLAVGDAEFQNKCLGKMQDVAAGGRTVLFVSHNMAAVESLCSSGIIIERGQLSLIGQITKVVAAYRAQFLDPFNSDEMKKRRTGAFFQDIILLDPDGCPTSVVPVGQPLRLRISLHAQSRIECPRIGIGINNELGDRQLTIRTPTSQTIIDNVDGQCHLECQLRDCPLRPGIYTIKLSASRLTGVIDVVDRAIRFSIVDGDLFNEGHGYHSGACVARANWRFTKLRHSVSTST